MELGSEEHVARGKAWAGNTDVLLQSKYYEYMSLPEGSRRLARP